MKTRQVDGIYMITDIGGGGSAFYEEGVDIIPIVIAVVPHRCFILVTGSNHAANTTESSTLNLNRI